MLKQEFLTLLFSYATTFVDIHLSYNRRLVI